MINNRAAEILLEMRQKSDRYAEKSTRLSELLERAECFLNELPGKVEITIADTKGFLHFKRCQGAWQLQYEADNTSFNNTFNVTEAPVHIKAAAAKLLPELIDTLLQVISERVSEVDAGLEALDTIEFLRDSEGGDQ